MLKQETDQADGLRRLLGKDGLRVVRLHAARRGVGKTAFAANLGCALRAKGRNVLILDEAGGSRSATAQLGLTPTADFARVAAGQCRFEQALAGSEALGVLVLGTGMETGRRLPAATRARLLAHLEQAARHIDTVIVDARPGETGALHALPAAAVEDILVLGTTGNALTEAYAWLKANSARHGAHRQHVLFNKVRDEEQACALYDNFAGAARRYLGIDLALLGTLPADEALRQSVELGAPAVQSFPLAAASLRLRQVAQAVTEWPRARAPLAHLGEFFRAAWQAPVPDLPGQGGSGRGHSRPQIRHAGHSVAMAA